MRTALLVAPFLLAGGLVATMPEHGHAEPSTSGMHEIAVTKTPTCGCCSAWVDLAREEGYEVTTTDTVDYVGMKSEAGVPEALWSCHTSVVDGYVVEGHVPFEAVRKLLEERPDIAGIAVPGMPIGSPGMGNDPDARYDVMAFGGSAEPDEIFYRAGR